MRISREALFLIQRYTVRSIQIGVLALSLLSSFGFAGDATHGAKGWHRRAGAIGQRLFPGTVMRGMKMPGHLGQVQRTTQNLEVIQSRPEDNVLLIKGAIPGSNGDYVIIRESKKMPPALVAKRRAAAEAKAKAAPAKKAKAAPAPAKAAAKK